MDEQAYTNFTPEEKCAAFDRIAACFLNQNFGATGKSDLELTFFSILMEHLRQNGLPQDNYIISAILGISQQRVRNLRLNEYLRNHRDYDWMADLASKAQKPQYSKENCMVTINLNDPVLKVEIEHFIEEQGGFVEFALNPKLLRMPTRDFAVLMLEVGLAKNEKAVWKMLRETYREEGEDIEEITKESLKTKIQKGTWELAKQVISAMANTAIAQII